MINFPHTPIEVREVDKKFLVVYSWDKLSKTTCPRPWENVELFDESGKKLWTVNGMDESAYWYKENDTFVGTRLKLGRVQLTSFGGSSYDINFENGHVTFFEFHK